MNGEEDVWREPLSMPGEVVRLKGGLEHQEGVPEASKEEAKARLKIAHRNHHDDDDHREPRLLQS